MTKIVDHFPDFLIPADVAYSEKIPVVIKVTCAPRKVFPDAIIKAEQFRHWFIRKGLPAGKALGHIHVSNYKALMPTKDIEKELTDLINTYGNIPGPLRREMLRAVENKIVLQNMDGDEKQQRLAMEVLKGMRTDPDLGMVNIISGPELGEGLKSLFAKLAPKEITPAVDVEFQDVTTQVHPMPKLIEAEKPKEVLVKTDKKNVKKKKKIK